MALGGAVLFGQESVFGVLNGVLEVGEAGGWAVAHGALTSPTRAAASTAVPIERALIGDAA